MKKNIQQEIKKIVKMKFVLTHSLVLATVLLCTAIFTKNASTADPVLAVQRLFDSNWLIVFMMVYVGSRLFSMEFRFGTIKNMLLTNNTRSGLFVGKFVTLVGYGCYLYAFSVIITLILARILFPKEVFGNSDQGLAIMRAILINSSSNFIGMLLFAIMAVAISLLVTNDSFGSMIGITMYFLSSMIAGIQFYFLQHHDWLKWNPFNMLNLSNQLNQTISSEMTQLSIPQLLIGNIGYLIVFILLAKIAFIKRKI